jgi:rRNA-processing protein FCF1
MKTVILDTSFILTCVKQKIDFFNEIMNMGFQIIIPKQVINEIKALGNSNARLALKILEKHPYKKIDLNTKKVDFGIINYAKDKDIIVATLDREIKEKADGPKLVIRQKKRLEVI